MSEEFKPQNYLTPNACDIFKLAAEKVKEENRLVFPEDILLELIADQSGTTKSILTKLNVNLEKLIEKLSMQTKTRSGGGTAIEVIEIDELRLSEIMKKIVVLAKEQSKILGYNFIGTEHIILAIIMEGSNRAAFVLHSFNITVSKFMQVAYKDLDNNHTKKVNSIIKSGVGEYPQKHINEVWEESKVDSVDLDIDTVRQFCVDFSELAENGSLDPVIGREEEIKRVAQVLCRRTKNNPILLGEAGVGKTAIVEGLAQAIHSGQVPSRLKGKRLFGLDLPLMLAGTKYRGQFEERLKDLMTDLRNNPQILLFIDEVHTIIGAGAAEGSMDAANILKPALSRGEIQCIGATTNGEFRKSIKKDSALERRFQAVQVNEPTAKQTIKILKHLAKKYEQYHNVLYTQDAIDETVRLAERYIYDRNFPDKAIDVIDEAGSLVQISQKPQKNVVKLQKRLNKLAELKLNALKSNRYLDAGKLYTEMEGVEKEIQIAMKDISVIVKIDAELIRKVVAKITNIPIEKLNQNQRKSLLKLEDKLNQEVVAQKEAVYSLVRSLIRSKAELKDSKRPIGSYLFLGPTGVGKTLLAKKLAENIFDNKNCFIQVDMSEYMEKFSLSRLIGSPPGYVGYQEGGELTKKVRLNPYSVILFDEVEKAHPDVTNILLQILEEGFLTDSEGNKVNFSNTIIILTSNVGAQLIYNQKRLGFSKDEAQDYEHLSKQVQREAEKYFKPEFLNRLDDSLVFHSLSKESLLKIVTLELKKTEKKLYAKGVKLKSNKKLKDYILEKSNKPEFGARPIRRAIESFVEDKIADLILAEELADPCILSMSVENGKIIHSISKSDE